MTLNGLKTFAKEWGSLLTLLGVAAGAGGMTVRQAFAAAEMDKHAAAVAKEFDELKGVDKETQHELRLQRIDDKLEVMSLTLTEIWDVLKRQDPRRQR